MAEEDPPGEKPHEPTPRKLEKAREKGELPRANELATAAAYGGLCVTLIGFGAPLVERMGSVLQGLLDRPEQLAPLFFGEGASAPAGGLLGQIALPLAPLFIIPAVAALIALIALRAIVVAPEKLKPKLSRISPVSLAKQKFGIDGLFEFFKAFIKLTIFAFCLFRFVQLRLEDMVMTLDLGPGQATLTLARLCVEFLFLIFIVSLVIGGIDYLWQRAQHLKKNRMTDKELRDEIKDSEGDPYVKQQRRMRGEALARNQTIADTKAADVVIVNPTHYAVALKWDRRPGSAPVCTAKGVDSLALAMRRAAEEAGVPVQSDPPTARRLHASVAVGAEIAPVDYRAVALAIRFADEMRRKAKGRIR